MKLPPRSNRDYMFNKLNWMTVYQLITYHTLIAVYRVRQSKEPEYLAELLGKDNKQGHIIIENTKLELYRDSFVFRGSVMWNKLPKNLRIEQKIGSFKRSLKTWVLDSVPRYIG